MGIRYKPTVDNDLMQIVDGEEVGTLGVRLAPDTADLFARAPEMDARIADLAAQLEERERECEKWKEMQCVTVRRAESAEKERDELQWTVQTSDKAMLFADIYNERQRADRAEQALEVALSKSAGLFDALTLEHQARTSAEQALAAAREELVGEKKASGVYMDALGVESVKNRALAQELAAAREENEWLRNVANPEIMWRAGYGEAIRRQAAGENLDEQKVWESCSHLAALRSLSDDAGRVERVAVWLYSQREVLEGTEHIKWEMETDYVRERYRDKARAVLAAADGEVKS